MVTGATAVTVGSSSQVTFTVTHNACSSTFANQTFSQSVFSTNLVSIQCQTGDVQNPWQTYTNAYSLTDADASFEENTAYDLNGNLLTFTTRSGNTIAYSYDVLNRVTSRSPANEPSVTLTYDLAGRPSTASTPGTGDPSTGTFQLNYDTAGRRVSEVYPDNKTVSHQLDANGNVTRTTWPDGYFVSYSFDQLNRLTEVFLNGSQASAAHYSYDPLSRTITLGYSNGASTTYSYQLNDDLLSIAEVFNGSSNNTFMYGYNNVHQRTSQNATDSAFIWHPSAASSTPYTTNTVNEYTKVGANVPTYDGNGNLSQLGNSQFSYDTENHLTGYTQGTTSLNYTYDPLQRQVLKSVAGEANTRLLYDRTNLIAEYDNATGNLLRRHIFGLGVNNPIIAVDASTGNPTFLHKDGIASVVAITDATGTILTKYAYSPFGESQPVSGTTFGFTSQRFDPENSLYFYKTRYLSPAIGRFLQPDVAGFDGLSNLYSYMANDPFNLIDPDGTAEMPNINQLMNQAGNVFQNIGNAVQRLGRQLNLPGVSGGTGTPAGGEGTSAGTSGHATGILMNSTGDGSESAPGGSGDNGGNNPPPPPPPPQGPYSRPGAAGPVVNPLTPQPSDWAPWGNNAIPAGPDYGINTPWNQRLPDQSPGAAGAGGVIEVGGPLRTGEQN